jgi:hypothetical protein
MLVTTRKAAKLTGLSANQLREWTNRRALIQPDIPPSGHGCPAKFTWQTILLLRLAAILRDKFRVELQTHSALFVEVRQVLGRTSFLFLWGKSLAIYGPHRWEFVESEDPLPKSHDAILLHLDTHLEILSGAFALPLGAAPGQLELFPARQLRRHSSVPAEHRDSSSPAAVMPARRTGR